MADVRRFTIGDGMVLIAATAAGMAWSSRAWMAGRATGEISVRSLGSWDAVVLLSAMVAPCLVAWTLGVCGLRMRSPRPRWRRASRQPGMTACLSASLALPIALIPVAVAVARQVTKFNTWADFSRMLPAALLETMIFAFPFVGLVVLVGWMTLAAQRQWRCERSWIDRAGRVLGVLWIASGGIFGVQFFEQMFR